MKKILALVALMLVAMVTLVACSQPAITKQNIRWENETHSYAISLANFENKVTTTDGTYYKDLLGYGEQPPSSAKKDQIVPTDANGTYDMSISINGENCTVTTEQVVYVTYKTSDVTLTLTEEQKQLYDVKNPTADTITLRSTTKTSVTFVNTTQAPIESSTEVCGFYVGKAKQNLNDYKVSTTYKAIKKGMEATVTVNGEKTTRKLEGASIIDSNQILTYLRSFDKTSTSFQNNPSVMVYEPYTNDLQKMTFSYVFAQNTLVEHKYASGESVETIPVAVNNVNVLIGGLPFMTQFNLPDMTEQNLDYKGSSVSVNANIPKYTPFRFRVGYLTFELQNYLTDNMVNTIKIKSAE